MGAGNAAIGELVNQLLAGQIIVPSIQRDYVWRPSQIPPLLESIYKQYPIGSILIWESTQPVPLKDAAVFQTQETVRVPLVLLDGQQRLTSLAWVWKPEKRRDGKLIDTRFNLETQKFKNPSKSDAANPLNVPVREVIGKDAEFAHVLEKAGVRTDNGMYAVYFQRLTKLNNAFNNFQVPVVTFSSDDYEVVADVFARVNQGGKRLSKGDLINSAIAARWPSGLDIMDKFHTRLRLSNYDLGSETALRLMGLIAGKGGKYLKLLENDMQADQLSKAWQETELALERGIDFLKKDCLIESSTLLTSLNLVIVPGYLLRHHKVLSESQTQQLRQWVYAAMAFSFYSSSVDSKLEAEINDIKEKSLDDALVSLRKRAFGTFSLEGSISPADLEGKKASSGLFNLLFIHALRNNARDWATSLSIQLKPLNTGFKIEYHHIFPKAQMKKLEGSKESAWNSLANLAFITAETNKAISDRLPSDYISAMPSLTNERLLEQLIPVDPELWRVENFEQFLIARRAMQAHALNDLIGLKPYAGGAGGAPELEEPDQDDADEGDLAFTNDPD
jgi:hypothetical protein